MRFEDWRKSNIGTYHPNTHDIYGPASQLPHVISGVNSEWLRGYGAPAPERPIVVGLPRIVMDQFFSAFQIAGHVTSQYGVRNEEPIYHPHIFICGALRLSWPQLWTQFRSFG